MSRSLLINMLWSFIGRFGYLTVGLITNIVLVRLLGPKEFGQVAIIMFFITIATVLTESGMSGALIRKKNVTETDYSTVFIFNLSISLILMIALILLSGSIADYYDEPELKELLVVSSFVLLINSFKITQNARLMKELKFKAKAIYEFVAVFVASAIAVLLAFKGAGVWSLVVLQISTSTVLTILLWFFMGPIGSYKFSVDSFKSFYKFGINTTLASLLNSMFDNIYQVILGRYFSITYSGYFYQAKKLQEMPVGILQTTMLGVVYSTLSKLQDSPKKFNDLYRNVVRVFTVLVGFICIVIFSYSDFIVSILYGAEWAISAFYLKLLIVASFFYLQEIFNRIIFKIFDKTEKILQLEVFKKIVQSCTIAYGVFTLSVESLLYGFIVTNVIGFLVNYYFARKVQGYFCWSDFFMIAKVFLAGCIVVYFNIFLLKEFKMEEGAELFLLFPLICILYITVLHLFKVINLSRDVSFFYTVFSRSG